MDCNVKSNMLRHKQTPEVLPASQYLQDRLQERRARNARPKHTRQSDFGPRMTAGQDDDLFFAEAEEGKHAFERSYESSPLAPMAKLSDSATNSTGSGTLNAGGRKRRMPGARELDEQMDRLTKQNFDLKLELDHRRENQARLHAEIEAMRATVARTQRLEEEHEELMRINSLLVEELEKRDRAIQEAADIICELEEKIEDYEEARPGTAHADSGYAGTEIQDHMLPSSPQEVANVAVASRQTPPAAATLASSRLNTAVRSPTPTKPRREPAFLTSQTSGTDALRAVYLEAGKDLHPIKSFNSILSRHSSTVDLNALAEEVLNSPRLSALSESSFPSIYGKKNETPEKYEWEELPESSRPYDSTHTRQDSITRVNQWIEDRHIMAETPSKPNTILSPVSTETMMPAPHVLRRSAENSIQSLSSVAASARSDLLDTSAPMRPFPTLGNRIKHVPGTPTSTSVPTFGETRLPPTPESASTRMPRPSVSGIAGSRSMLDLAPTQVRNPVPVESAHNGGKQEFAPVALTLKEAVIDGSDDDSDDEFYEARSNTRQDGSEYDGYPDGNSISNGTPSRFLEHGKKFPGATGMFYNTSYLPQPTVVHAAQRRKSSSEIPSTPYKKPGFHRAETSPNAYGLIPRRMNQPHGRPTTSDSAASPYSYNSAYSSVRTSTQDRGFRSLSPEPSQPIASSASTPSPPKSRPHPVTTPTSTSRYSFTQKTHNLFRRLSSTASNYSGDEPRSTPRREREVSPLPTLTSTPSWAYQMPHPERREIRRPNTSASMRRTSASREPSSSRPPFSPRTITEPNFSPSESGIPPGSTDLSSTVTLKRSLFRRGGSIKHADVSSVKSLRR